jgi:hypothetical protein
MDYKTNWPVAKEYWTALWEGRHKGRPCITVNAPNGKPNRAPAPRSGEERWLGPEFNVQLAQATFESTYYGGESFPGHLLMASWVTQTYGATPHFPMNTIWFEPIPVDWDRPPTFDLDWESPWFKKVAALHRAFLAAAGRDRFFIGSIGGMPANDILSLVIGAENMLCAMAERPEWVRTAILKLTENWIRLVQRFRDLSKPTHEFWYGNGGWMPFWAPEPFVSTQSDISCMISSAMFDEFIVPELDLIGQAFKNVWYHLDGQSAFQQLPRLLALPYIKVVQFVPEAGTPPNGPAYLDLYRKIQAAGKIVHIQVPAQNVEPLCRQLDPARLCLCTDCGSVKEADTLLANAERWTRG